MPNWVANNQQYFSYPTIVNSKNLLYKCSFNFTVDMNNKQVPMYQNIDLNHFSVFIDSGISEYQSILDVGNCE